MPSGRGGSRLGDMLLFALLAALWGAFCFSIIVMWRLYNRSLGAVAGRPVEYCRSLFLVPAQLLGLLGGVFLLTGTVGLSGPRTPGVIPISLLMLSLGVGSVFLTRVLIRRGSL